jgi:hypothetical protein
LSWLLLLALLAALLALRALVVAAATANVTATVTAMSCSRSWTKLSPTLSLSPTGQLRIPLPAWSYELY